MSSVSDVHGMAPVTGLPLMPSQKLKHGVMPPLPPGVVCFTLKLRLHTGIFPGMLKKADALKSQY